MDYISAASNVTIAYTSVDDPHFVITHVTVNIILSAVGFFTCSALLRKNGQTYADSKVKCLGAVEGNLMLACLIIISVYLPSMTASLLTDNFLQRSFLCFISMWIYGTVHGTTVLLHTLLSVLWMVRCLWPFASARICCYTMSALIACCWVFPATLVAITVVTASGYFSYPARLFCLCDLDLTAYLTIFIIPSVIVGLFSYTVCLTSWSEWRKLHFELSPRVDEAVNITDNERSLMNAHAMSYLIFTALFGCWKILFDFMPFADLYSSVVLTSSFVLTPTLICLSNKNVYSCVLSVVLRCCTCMKGTSASTTPMSVPSDHTELPPPYTETDTTMVPAAARPADIHETSYQEQAASHTEDPNMHQQSTGIQGSVFVITATERISFKRDTSNPSESTRF